MNQRVTPCWECVHPLLPLRPCLSRLGSKCVFIPLWGGLFGVVGDAGGWRFDGKGIFGNCGELYLVACLVMNCLFVMALSIPSWCFTAQVPLYLLL